jgi:hypothetical protein
LLSQYRFSAPCTLMNHTNIPTIGSSIQSPAHPVKGASRPFALKSSRSRTGSGTR